MALFDKPLSQWSNRALSNLIREWGKNATARLRSIERANLQKSSQAYKYIERQSYDGAPYLTTTKTGKVKFDITTKGLSHNELVYRANEIKKFIEAGTSTVTRIQKKSSKAYETFTARYPNVELTPQRFSEIYADAKLKKFADIFGSKEIIAISQRSKGQLTDTEIIDIIESSGIDLNNKYKEPPELSSFYELMDKAIKVKKSDGTEAMYRMLTEEEEKIIKGSSFI